MASFRAKLGWKMPRKSENKSYHSVSFQPDAKYKLSKKQGKNSKYKKQYRYGYISSQNMMENDLKKRK